AKRTASPYTQLQTALNKLKQRHRQMRERFGHRQLMAILMASGTRPRPDAPACKNVAVTAREFIFHSDRRVAPDLRPDGQAGRQSDEKSCGDHYRRLRADPAREADDVAFALARRLQRQVFALLEKLAVVSAVVERAGCDEHLDPSVRGRAQQLAGQGLGLLGSPRIEQASGMVVIGRPAGGQGTPG